MDSKKGFVGLDFPNGNLHHEMKKGLSVATAIVFIAGELAGSGVLALPSALAGTGWGGIALVIVSGLIAAYSGVCLARSWLMLEERWPEYRTAVRNPFASIGYRSHGNWMSYVCSAVMDITFFGGCVVYLLLCAELMESLMHSYLKYITFCDWIIILGIVLLPLTWLGSPADFWPLAVGAIGTTILGLILLMFEIIKDSPEYLPKATYSEPTFKSFFLAFGIIVFAFGGAAAFPTFQNDMKDKTKFPIAVVIGFIILITLYLPISVTGYAVYGSTVTPDILQTLNDGWVKTSIAVLFAIHLFLAFLIIINPVTQELETFVNIPNRFGYKRCITRSLLMIAITFTALSVPQFGKILSLIGGSTITLMTFVLPPLFYMKLVADQHLVKEWPKRYISLKVKTFLIITIAVGLIAGIASTYSAVYELVDPQAFKPPCYVSFESFYRS